jgi:uncharacterized membrane protein HdeD (DUF308 family)
MAERSNYGIAWGIILILIGLFLIALPFVALGIAAIILGLFVIFRSLALFTASSTETGGVRTSVYVLGVIGLIIGILMLISPLISVVAIAILLGIGLVIIGIGDLVRAVAPNVTMANRGVSILIAILSFIFAGLIFASPLMATRTLVQIAGGFAIVFGILDIIVGYYAARGGKVRTTEVRTVTPRPA